MKNILKLFGVLIFIGLLMWLSKQHNDIYASAPYSNISTTKISTGYFLKTNDFGTNESFAGSFTILNIGGTNVIFQSDGTNISLIQFEYTTNLWSGPTNSLDMSFRHQYYSSLTPCYITNVINGNSSFAMYSLLKIFNASATNILVTMPVGTRIPYGDTNQDLLTNGDIWMGAFEVGDNHTNVVKRMFH